VQFGAEEWAAVGGRERFTPATLAMSGPDDAQQVGVPFLSRPFVMAYNTELFAQAGLPGPPQTWDQLVEYGKALTREGVHGVAAAYADDYDPWKFIWMFANQCGNPLVDGDRVRLDDPTVQRAYQEYFGFLTEDGIVDPEAIGWKSPQALASFAEGRSAMMLMTTPTSIPTLDSSAVAGKYAYAPMPAVPPGESALPAGGVPATTIVSGDNIAIADYSDDKELALAFVELVTSEQEQLHYTEVFGDLPTNAAAAEKITSSNAALAPILEAGAGAVPTPFTGAWSEVQLALTNVAVQSRAELAAGSVPPEVIASRLAEAQQSSQNALDRAGQ
jgi:multiple sugar transport system substrate-binding protein